MHFIILGLVNAMASIFEQSVAPGTTDGYFQKAPSIGSVPAKRTRNFDTKGPAVSSKSRKTSSQSKPTQQVSTLEEVQTR